MSEVLPSMPLLLQQQREVHVEWQEPLDRREIKHQLEPGEKPPVRTRSGVVLQFLWTSTQLRADAYENKVQAVVLDYGVGQILVKSLAELRVVLALPRPLAEQPYPPAEPWRKVPGAQ